MAASVLSIFLSQFDEVSPQLCWESFNFLSMVICMAGETESQVPFYRLKNRDVECKSCEDDDAVVVTICCGKPICSDCAEEAMRITRRGNLKVDCPIDDGDGDCDVIVVRLPYQ